MSDATTPDVTPQGAVIAPAAAGRGVAGRAPALTLIFDRNGNGIPDWKEPDELVQLVEDVMTFVLSAAPGGGPVAQVARFVLNEALPIARDITPLLPEPKP